MYDKISVGAHVQIVLHVFFHDSFCLKISFDCRTILPTFSVLTRPRSFTTFANSCTERH
jgi:hypothetical protein